MSPLTATGRPRRGLRTLARPRFVVPVAVVAAAAAITPALLSNGNAQPVSSSTVQGWPDSGATLSPARLATMTVRVAGADPTAVRASIDGRPVQLVTGPGGPTFRPGQLTDGRHEIAVVVDGRSYTRDFTVDSTPPALTVATPKPVQMGDQLALSGTVEPGATVTANGHEVSVHGAAWTADFPKAPPQIAVVATDAAGNEAKHEVSVKFRVPFTRAVHMTADAWAYKPLRNPVLALIKAHRINAVEVDIKDEDGVVGYKSHVPLAKRDGATKESAYDAKQMLGELHRMHVRVIGRLVAFHDPKLATWAWKHGHRDWVIQGRDGTPWQGTYGSYAFSNFANSEVQQYNIDLAVEAAKLGFDDILYDYVRRPDGKLSEMHIPGLKSTGEAQVAEFVHRTREALARAGTDTFLGASVFGVSATRPKEVAQNIAMIAKYADYVSPMVYPSHWAPGEYGVGDPNSHPYPIVQRSLKDFNKQVEGTNAIVIPWLQDFSLGVHYTPDMVLAEEKAAHDDSIEGFLLWNAGCSYDVPALPVLTH